MKTIFIILAFAISGCATCPPAKDIMNGKAAQKHDQKKFHGTIRIMWTRQYGNFCKVRYANYKTIENRVYENCDCKKFVEGSWVRQDSI